MDRHLVGGGYRYLKKTENSSFSHSAHLTSKLETFAGKISIRQVFECMCVTKRKRTSGVVLSVSCKTPSDKEKDKVLIYMNGHQVE